MKIKSGEYLIYPAIGLCVIESWTQWMAAASTSFSMNDSSVVTNIIISVLFTFTGKGSLIGPQASIVKGDVNGWTFIILENVFMIIGLILEMKTTSLISEKSVKKIVIILLMISGIALIINNI